MIRRIGIAVRDGGHADHNAYWRMPRSRDEAQTYPIQLPVRTTWIGLDPATSSPFALVIVDVPGLGPSLLTPGSLLPVPDGHSIVHMWNGHHATILPAFPDGYWDGVSAPAAGYTLPTVYGRASLVAGDDSTREAWLAYANVTKPAPRVGAILRVSLVAPVVADSRVIFPTNGLRGYRIAVAPGDAAGVGIWPIPATFSATLIKETWVLDTYDQHARGAVLDTGASFAGTVPADELGAGNTFVPTLPLPPGVNGTPPMLEVPVTVESYATGYRLTALAGVGVGSAIISVEGY